jgi:hypothetical protein
MRLSLKLLPIFSLGILITNVTFAYSMHHRPPHPGRPIFIKLMSILRVENRP